MKIKFYKGMHRYHTNEKCLGFSIVFDNSADVQCEFSISLYIELILWQVWFELDFIK